MHLQNEGVEKLPLRGGRRREGGQQLLRAGGTYSVLLQQSRAPRSKHKFRHAMPLPPVHALMLCFVLYHDRVAVHRSSMRLLMRMRERGALLNPSCSLYSKMFFGVCSLSWYYIYLVVLYLAVL